MTTGEDSESSTLPNEMMDDIRRELIQQVAAADRDANRDIYDALADE
ncbi:hypothetical protein [Natrialba sp. SSL1]|nr:hypothetical protein [Natrialba sp. SSL1]